MNKPYKYLIFDLDHTLWDFDKNSEETIWQLFYEFELDLKLKIKPGDFVGAYQLQNRQLWKLYETGKIDKENLRWQRFEKAMNNFSYSNHGLAQAISSEYLAICPYKTNLIPFAREILVELSARYKMGILTNGFEEVQHVKIHKSGLERFFDFVITADAVGSRKPHGSMFRSALNFWQAERRESLMIGDSFHSDIVGARKFGIDQVYYNPRGKRHNQKPTYHITCLSELRDLLKQ